MLSALREADVIACEDTRTTKVLLDRYGVSAERVRYDAHAERRVAPRLVERMREGAVVALVSDAGMPLVCDPGLVLVQACMAAGLEVEVLPGPSAALAALVASGMEAATWRFVGFLPRKKGALAEVFASPEVVVAFESPRRVAASLAVLAQVDPVAAGGGVPRADQGLRGGRPRLGVGARGALRAGGPARGGRARRRARRRPTRPTSGPRWRRCGGWSTRAARGRGRPPGWWPSSPGRARMRCIAR